MLAAVAAVQRARTGWLRLGLAASGALAVAFIAATVAAHRAAGIAAPEGAYGSIVLGLLGFQWLVVALAVVMLVIAQLWAWLAPRDPRGHGVVFNAALVLGFCVVSWLVVFATLYLSPRLG
jgi:cytochrome c oxidase subunit 3